MEKLAALFDLFRKGSAVADSAAWKKHQITATMIGLLLMAIGRVANAYGYPLPIDQATADAIAAGLIALINCLLTVATTDKIGLPRKAESEQPGPDDRGGDRPVVKPDESPQITQL